MRQKIAIIGSGISGLVAGHYLHSKYDITIFEKEDWIGGHSHTISVNKDLAVDTGFIVFNNRNYPNFKQLLDELGVKYQPTEMSFAVRNDEAKLEYKGSDLKGLFADRFNIIRPKFYRLILEILRFNSLAKTRQYDPEDKAEDFIKKHKFSRDFVDGYLLPMGSAIWSMGLKDMYKFPMDFLVKFFANHGLLDLKNRPQWYTIVGGSQQYVEKLVAPFHDKILLNSEVVAVRRQADKVLVSYRIEQKSQKEFLTQEFDHVIFACHSPQVISILADNMTSLEYDVLSQIKTSANNVVLHTDTNLLPRRPHAYASWNYLFTKNSNSQATVTYNMNILQRLSSFQTASTTYCVTLNGKELIDPSKIIAEFNYYHPIYTVESMLARMRWDEISGVDRVHFCGAYWYNGFHEDGVVSALKVCQFFSKDN